MYMGKLLRTELISRCYERGGIERIVEVEGAAAAVLQYPQC